MELPGRMGTVKCRAMPGAKGYRRKHDRHLPRGWFSLFLRLGGWSALLAAALLLLATLFSALSLRVADRLDAAAGYATATVTSKGARREAGSSETWRVGFTYKTEAGGRSTEVAVPREFFDSVRIGSEVPVRYLRADPGRIEMEPPLERTAGYVLMAAALAIGLAGLWALWRFGNEANAAILARRDGERRMARVTGIADANVVVNNRMQARLEWRENDGRTGRSLMRDRDELERLYKPGDPIVVYRRDTDAFWEGDVGPPVRASKG